MAYCTITNLKKIIDESTLLRMADDTGSAPDLDDAAVAAVIEEAIEQADTEIDSYLATRYTLPLSLVPIIITRLSARMAVYYLTLRRDRPRDEKWEAVYKRAVEMLTHISKGTISLNAPLIQADSAERPKPCMVTISSKFSKWRAF